MGRSSFTEAKKGRKAFSGGSNNEIVNDLKYESGQSKRVVAPIHEGKLVVFSAPIHKVLNYRVKLPKKAGGTYTVHEVRCQHVYNQSTDEEALAIAKKGEGCLFCDIARLEGRQQWDTIRTQYGDDFREMTKDEKKAIFKSIQSTHTVDSAFITSKDEEGNVEISHTSKSFILLLEIATSTDGNTVIVDGSGNPVVTPILLPMTSARAEKFKSAVDDAIDMDTLKYADLTPYVENEGTDLEEEILIGWVDFKLKFPQRNTKVESAKDMGVLPIKKELSVINPEFIAKYEAELPKYVANASFTFNNIYKNLKVTSKEEALEYIADSTDENGNVISGEEYYNNLVAKYRKETEGDILGDVEKEQSQIESIIAKFETPAETTSETPVKEVVVETPVEEVAVETPVAETPVEEVAVETPVEESPKRVAVKKRAVAKKEEVLDEEAFSDEEFDF